MKKYIILIISLVASTIGMAQQNDRIEIPFTMDRNLILISANLSKIGQQTFIFDTGTEGILLASDLRTKYKVVGVDSMRTPDGEFVETQDRVNIPKVKFGGFTLSNKVATKFPRQMILSNKAVGIIGIQTFVGYTITFDYKNSKLILSKGSLQGQANTMPITLDHLLEAKIKLNEKEVLAHFDCGAVGYIAIPKKWDNIYKLKNEPVLAGRGRTPMGDFDIFKADLDGNIEVGNYKLKDPKITLLSSDIFYSVNFGYEFFKQHLITLDTQNKLMQILSI